MENITSIPEIFKRNWYKTGIDCSIQLSTKWVSEKKRTVSH
jgi:hypothetical protein